MKHTERQHLKENELAHSLATASHLLGRRKSTIVTVSVVVGVVLAGAIGYAVVTQQSAAARAELLSAATTVLDAPVQPPNPAVPPMDGKPGRMAEQQPGTYPTEEAKLAIAIPKLIAVVQKYPADDAGLLAGYRLGQAYSSLGKHADAVSAFEKVMEKGPASLHGRMARLAKANEQVLLGQHQAAIATYQALVEEKDSKLPVDGLLMQLASAYSAAGKPDQAKQTYSRIVHEHPTSPFAAEAGRLIQ